MKSAETSIKSLLFQLTHPTRGATFRSVRLNAAERFQLTHPTRGATPVHMPTLTVLVISTHTPHTGCDHMEKHEIGGTRDISTHTPHTGCDIFATI